ncbi:TadE/TadG family type IV pilus assembly protein [Mesorhizobium sp. NBSH29]|uniref:TadE/TadG family type IV pilus assembly protein n=1 Tax=Mesorhizobium sp. NBSH29 TaxID=2654249 RepID=UPI0021562111|nr:TadE/TadG family type IV pilus assembly protein [Mesorhizobium sp. NBSH29]
MSRFSRDEHGSTAIEFGILALPFLMLLFAILETGISFAAQQLMANATDDVARQIRTGQLTSANLTQSSLRDKICVQLEMMVTKGCPGLAVDLRLRSTFAELAQIKAPLKGSGREQEIDLAAVGFEVGKGADKSTLRVLYGWPIISNLMQKSLSTMKGSKMLLYASATWQNEPF